MNESTQLSTAFQRDLPSFPPNDSTISSINPSYIRVAQNTSNWAEQLEKRFNELTALTTGWDGYSGQPVSFSCATFAANLLEQLYISGVNAPQLVPGGDGTVQIEWHEQSFDIEIDISAPYDVLASRFDHLSYKEDEVELEADFTVLSDWLSELDERSIASN